MVASTLQIIPDELSFPFELSKIATSTLMLCNTSVNKITYRIKTTNPKRYGVRPSSGFVDAGSTTAVLVILQKHQATGSCRLQRQVLGSVGQALAPSSQGHKHNVLPFGWW